MIYIDNEFQSLIPKLSNDEYALLEESIITEGCRDALVVWNNAIIDGHNRYEICQKHGIVFEIKTVKFESKDYASLWIINNQFARRNLQLIDRGILALRKKPILARIAKENQLSGLKQYQDDTVQEIFPKRTEAIDVGKELAKEAGMSDRTLDKIEKIVGQSSPEIIQSIREGELTINKAYNYLKREEIKEQTKEIEQPKGKYRIIYADPAWQYADKRDGNTTGAEDHYKTMTISELCELPIKDISEDNAVLFLWVTSPLLEDSFSIIKAWGFQYKTSFVWDKIKHNMGHYNSVRHELLLIATKGSCLPDNKKLYDSVQSIERSDTHSEKPEFFRQIIDELYTYGNRIELFARKKAEGWEGWGFEYDAGM